MNDKLIVPLDTTENELASRRTAEEIERDRTLLARMYVRGKSQHEMRLSLNSMYPDRPLSGSTINQDLQAIRNAWLNSTLVDFNEAKSKELARLDELEREAWLAWERSKDKHIRIEYEVADNQVAFSVDKIANVHGEKKHKVIEATVGDIKYLEMVERSVKMRCDIFGLFEAKKIQVDWRTEALASGLDEETIDAVKEKTINVLLEAISNAAKESGAIKETDIIDAELEDTNA
jgi:hypothetical protein